GMERIPTKPEIQDQIRCDPEIVLNKCAAQSAAALRILTTALDEPVGEAHQIIRARIAAIRRAAEAELPVLAESVDQVDLHSHHVPADSNFMTAANPVNAVCEMKILTIEGARMPCAHAEIASDLDNDLGRIGGRNRYSQARQTEGRAAQDRAMNPVERKNEAVEQRGMDVVCGAERGA